MALLFYDVGKVLRVVSTERLRYLTIYYLYLYYIVRSSSMYVHSLAIPALGFSKQLSGLTLGWGPEQYLLHDH